MLAACLLTLLFCVAGKCQNILAPQYQHDHQKLIQCTVNIINKYFSERKTITYYVSMHPDDDIFLKAIHSTLNVSLISRQSSQQMFVTNRGYLIFSADVANFTKYFEYLRREPTWNPYARFLIIITSIQNFQLRIIFDELLKLHVNNALVATDDGQLYTYNPFDNYACGRYYDTVIGYGLCSQTTQDLYPNKLVTGLKKCNFTATVDHRPPFGIDPRKKEDRKALLGTEEYIITILGNLEQFTVSFNYSSNSELYSTVAPNMSVIGPMAKLQKNECDIIFGGIMIVTARAEAFTYLCGYHDYSEELTFAVKRSSLKPTWKYIYLEFELDVWACLLAAFIVFSIIIVILLRAKDVGAVVLLLLDNLLLHGRDTRTRLTVKCVLITWVWFAYLINTFYQSNLFSFTTHPSKDFQVVDEEDITKYNVKPCFSYSLQKYLHSEATNLANTQYIRYEGCSTTAEAMDTVSTRSDMFTLVPNYYYLYNERKYKDMWGNPLIYYFHKPYTKYLFGFFFYKGFPVTKSLKLNALRMRENGLADKSLHDQYYVRRLKQKFSNKPFNTQFFFPWYICILGLTIGTIAFIAEVIIKYSK